MTRIEPRSLKSSNPVLSRRVLGRHGGRKTAGGDPLVEVVVPRRPFRPVEDERHEGRAADPVLLPHLVGDLLTLRAVLIRTAVAFGITAPTAVLSWLVPPVPPTSAAASYGVAGVAGLAVGVLVVVQCRGHRPSAPLTLAFALFQGAFLGVLSNTVSAQISPGVFVQVVLGTVAAFAGVLAAYALRWIRVNRRRFHGFAAAAVLGLLVLTTADLPLSLTTRAAALGFERPLLGVVLALTGLVLGTCFLSLHFRRVEDEIARGTPVEQSWSAAFGLTLTLVWLYVETVRLLTLVPEDDFY